MSATAEETLQRLRDEPAIWAEHLAKIVDKQRQLIPFIFNEGQQTLDGMLRVQRETGLPERAIALKSRQIGVSTYVQARAIQQTTLNQFQAALVIAHDKETTKKLFRIGERIYDNLPPIPEVKPNKISHRRGTFLHFGDEDGGGWPDSTYLVDTAGERESGRGGTYTLFHGSEVAVWPDIATKLTALGEAIPDEPETLVVLESTANGANEFKDLWTDAVEGRSDFAPFFWPWWKQAEYTLPFANDDEREAFERRVGTGPYGEDEPALLNPGPLDTITRQHVPLTLEQLHWRRRKIASPYFGGKLDKLKQEHPTTPQEAFVSSGRQVFEPSLVQVIVDATDLTDPRIPTAEFPGPEIGQFKAASKKEVLTRSGPQQIPASAIWIPKSDLSLSEDANWRLWLKDTPEITDGKPTGQFIIGSDISGEVTEKDGWASDEPAWDTIEVIGHESRLQVAEWRGRLDSDLLAEQIYLACLHFNKPWAAPEATGYGGAVIRKLFMDYKYPYLYKRRSHGTTMESQVDRYGFSTDRATKPLLDANFAEAIRDGTHGIRSRALALELTTYIRDSRGRTRPEKGKFSDLLMAYSIAQFVADIQPMKKMGGRRGPDKGVGYA